MSDAALFNAASKGRQGVIKSLLENGQSPDPRNPQGATPLMEAAKRGWLSSVKELLRGGADWRLTDNEGLTALHHAACKDRPAVARALVSAGAAVDHPSSGGNWRTALHLAAAAGNVETACALLDAAVESGDSPGLSSASSGPLYAAARGQFKAIQALGRAGTSGAASSSRKLQACLSARDSGGCTPLHCAAAGGCAPSVRALLLAGAPVGEANNEGDSPLHSLVRGWEPARADQYAAAAAALLDSKADPAAPNRQGETPVGLAAAWGLAPLEQLLQAALDKAARQEERSRLHDSFPGLSRQSPSPARHPPAEERRPKLGGMQSDPVLALLLKAARAENREGAAATVVGNKQKALGTANSGSGSSSNVDGIRPWQIDFKDIKLIEEIGGGSFGRVFRAKWHETVVAVKILLNVAGAEGSAEGGSDRPLTLSNPALANLQKEAGLMASLRHPNVVSFLGVCASPPCVVIEYCARGSLHDVLRDALRSKRCAAQLDWARRLNMMLDAAKGMLYLSSRTPPVIHRDLKSANLLVTKDYTVKVCDFNLAKILEDSGVHSSVHATNPRWLAPEILQGQPAQIQSDVYSFGVVLWEVLTYQTPFADANQWQLVHFVTAGGRLPLPEDPADLPGGTFPGLPAYLALMQRCWAQEPAERPGFAEIINLLRNILLLALPQATQQQLSGVLSSGAVSVASARDTPEPPSDTQHGQQPHAECAGGQSAAAGTAAGGTTAAAAAAVAGLRLGEPPPAAGSPAVAEAAAAGGAEGLTSAPSEETLLTPASSDLTLSPGGSTALSPTTPSVDAAPVAAAAGASGRPMQAGHA